MLIDNVFNFIFKAFCVDCKNIIISFIDVEWNSHIHCCFWVVDRDSSIYRTLSIKARLKVILLELLVLLMTSLVAVLVFYVLIGILVHHLCIILWCVLWLYVLVEMLLLRIIFILNID